MSLISQAHVDESSSEYVSGLVPSRQADISGVPAMTLEGILMVHEPLSRL